MPLFPFKKKKQHGTTSKIKELKSPYLKKPSLPSKKAKKIKKAKPHSSLFIPPPKLRANNNNKKKIWGLFLAGFSVISIAIYIIFYSNIFVLKSWEILDNNVLFTRDHPLHQALARQRNKNLFFIDENKIISEFKAFFPDLEGITIKKILPQKIIVEIKRYPIKANLINVITDNPSKVSACKTSSNQTQVVGQKKFLINSMGLLVQENNENPEYPYIKFATTQAKKIKEVPFPKEKLDYILKAISLFSEKFDNMAVINATYKMRERELHLCTEKRFEVWIDMEKNLEPQLNKLKEAQSSLNMHTTPLEYIDLRISGPKFGKIIFKPRKS